MRELQNVSERAVVLSEGETLVIDESWLARKQRKPSNGTAVLGIPRQTLEWKIRNLNIDKLAFRER